MGFDQSYWEKNYSEPDSMDGIGNAKEHASYAKAFFTLEEVAITSIIDLGFGYAHLLKAFAHAFKPKIIQGIEPSAYAYEKAKKTIFAKKRNVKLKKIELKDWVSIEANPIDLAICSSVMQYISDAELIKIIPRLAERVRYLYLTVPTDIELDKQVREHGFKDDYALYRTQAFYYKILSPHFTVVGNRILESKYYFNEYSTHFSDLFYRF